jgi:hypothetical protein
MCRGAWCAPSTAAATANQHRGRPDEPLPFPPTLSCHNGASSPAVRFSQSASRCVSAAMRMSWHARGRVGMG